MAVEITNREYLSRHTPLIVDWLLGNTGDWLRLNLTLRFAVERKFSIQVTMVMQNTNNLILSDGKHWSEFGFDTGDTVVISYRHRTYDSSGNLTGTTITTETRTVTSLNGDNMLVDGADLNTNQWSTYPYFDGSNKIDNVIVYSDKQPEGCEVNYGLIQNANVDALNVNSFIDGSTSKLTYNDMQNIVGYPFMNIVGTQSGMSIKFAQISYNGKVGTHTYSYTIGIEFMIHSFMDDITNFENLTQPDETVNAASLTDNFNIVGYPEWNNPNTRITNDMNQTKRLGNTGWFNENFNQLPNTLVLDSINYFDSGTGIAVNGLSYGNDIDVVILIDGATTLNPTDTGDIGFAWIPDEEDLYKNKLTPFHENLMVNTGGGQGFGGFTLGVPDVSTKQGFSAYGTARMDFSDVLFSDSGGQLKIEAKFKPTAAFTTLMESLDSDNRNYLLWISWADSSLITNFSNRVNLIVDFKNMELIKLPVGSYPEMKISMYNHTESPIDTEAFDYNYKEDDVLAKIEFPVDITSDIPNTITFAIEAEKISTGESFNLQKYSIDLTQYPNNGAGVPQWNYDASRGFKLESGNNKNWVKILRDPLNDLGNDKAYLALYGFKLRWEDWISKLGVPADFFDSTKANNGFNNDWEDYEISGWELKFKVFIDSTLNGDPVKYENKRLLSALDYDINPEITTSWRYYRELTNTLVTNSVDAPTGRPVGVLFGGEKTRIEVDFERLDGSTWQSVSDVYATICLEVENGAGQFDFRQLSSYWGSESDNPLVPIASATKLDLTLVSPTKITAICLVDANKLNEVTRYKLTSRLGCKLN